MINIFFHKDNWAIWGIPDFTDEEFRLYVTAHGGCFIVQPIVKSRFRDYSQKKKLL